LNDHAFRDEKSAVLPLLLQGALLHEELGTPRTDVPHITVHLPGRLQEIKLRNQNGLQTSIGPPLPHLQLPRLVPRHAPNNPQYRRNARC